LEQLSLSGRGEWFKSEGNNKKLFEQIVRFVLVEMKSSYINAKDYTGYKEMISVIWSQILVKGMSDVSQYGALLTNINKLQKKVEFPPLGKMGDIVNFTNYSQPEYIGVSSDKIAAALMTNVASLYSHPLQILCTRKSGAGTAFIICQKQVVSALAVIIGLKDCNPMPRADFTKFTTLHKLKQRIDIILYQFLKQCVNDPSIGINYTMIDKIFDNIFALKTHMKFLGYGNIMDTIKNAYNRPPLTSSNELSEQQIIHSLLYKNPDIIHFLAVIEMFDKIAKLITPEIEQSLIEYSDMISTVTVNRFAYYISNAIFKIKYPIADVARQISEQYSQTGKQSSKPISRLDTNEIISASYDSIYGHDFEVDAVTQLGLEFLSYVDENEPAILSREANERIIKNKKHEDNCIIEVLRKNKFATIGQQGSVIKIVFDPEINLLVDERPTLPYVIGAQWELFQSPVNFAPIFYSIDFTAGLQPYIAGKTDIYNALLSRNDKSLSAIEPDKPISDFIKTLQQLNAQRHTYEVYTPATEFDGAAPYGLIPISINDDYISKITLYDKAPGNNNITIRVVTRCNRVRTIDDIAIKNIKIEASPLTIVYEGLPQAVLEKLRDPNNSYAVRFNNKWITILQNVKGKFLKDHYSKILIHFKNYLFLPGSQRAVYDFFRNRNTSLRDSILDKDTYKSKEKLEACFNTLFSEYIKTIVENDNEVDRFKKDLLTIFFEGVDINVEATATQQTVDNKCGLITSNIFIPLPKSNQARSYHNRTTKLRKPGAQSLDANHRVNVTRRNI
jgi:hypothetical protein